MSECQEFSESKMKKNEINQDSFVQKSGNYFWVKRDTRKMSSDKKSEKRKMQHAYIQLGKGRYR